MDNKFGKILLILLVLVIGCGCLFLGTRNLELSKNYNTENDIVNYRDFAKAVANMEDTFVFDDKEDAEAAYDELVRIHPEIFWLDNFFPYEDNADGTITIEMQYRTNKIFANLNQIILNIKLKSLVNKIKDMDDVAKAKYVHDYILRTASYNKSGKYAHTALGCLVYKDTVCQGYADAYRMIMNDAGVECGLVWGKAGGDDHAWNYILIDDNYYMVDVTWNDPVWNKDLSSIEDHYAYFLVSTDTIEKTHSIASDCPVPYCMYDHEMYH